MSMAHDRAVEDYQRDGVARVAGLLRQDDLQHVRAALDRYIREVLPGIPPGDRTLEADGKTVRNLWRMEQHDPFFKSLAQRPDILGLVGRLVRGDPILVAVETFNKPAKVGSGVPHHQDNAYFCQNPPDMLTVWIAIDAATMENGPIYYVIGSHKLGTLPHKPSGVAGNSMGMVDAPLADADRDFCGTLAPGDALIHHCQTIHYSAPNKSDRSRCGLLLVYRGAHTASDPQLQARYNQARAT
jgi:ectoine hydroxylase-related dioxygenase (phytanoyl-CoA dioxygenase family)